MSPAVALGLSVLAFTVGFGFGILACLIFAKWSDEEKQAKAVADENARWHHPRSGDDG